MNEQEGLRYRRARHVLWRRTLDTVVVLPAASQGEPFTLAATGPELWGLLQEPRSLDDLVDRLAELHGVEPDVVRADVEPLLVELLDLGAIERA